MEPEEDYTEKEMTYDDSSKKGPSKRAIDDAIKNLMIVSN
jgi:hypothetical protein